MEAIEFKGVNAVYGHDQDQYKNLPAMKVAGIEGLVITKWLLSEAELELINKTKSLFLSTLTFNSPLQPLMLSILNPIAGSDTDIGIDIDMDNGSTLDRLEHLRNQISDWSDKTFNNGIFDHSRSLPISKHLVKESKELVETLEKLNSDSTDKSKSVNESVFELADVFMLLLDCASKLGMDSADLISVTEEKLEINKKRKCGKPDNDGVVEHVR